MNSEPQRERQGGQGSCLAKTSSVHGNISEPPAELVHASASAATDLEGNTWDFDEKPRVPYKKGFTITAFRHEPPEPFGLGYATEWPPEQVRWNQLSQVDHCLSRPSRKGRSNHSVYKTLTVTSTIRTGRDRGAQIVVVNRNMVAKIYDPLYYPAHNEYGIQQDVIVEADGDYSREAAAFEQLQSSTEARAIIPAYYGTWSMDVVVEARRNQGNRAKITRSVYFVLMERLHGDCMVDLDAEQFKEEVRSLILRKAIVAETIICNAGVTHRDVCPRNILIQGSNYDDDDVPICDIEVDIKVIDFNIALVAYHPRTADRLPMDISSQRQESWPFKLPSPIVTRYGRMGEFSAEGWCSNEDREAEKWLWQQFHNDDRFRPVMWDPTDPEVRPKYVENSHSDHGSSDSGISMEAGADRAEI